jgi:flagellar biosynthetic protein FlhB
MPEDNKTEQATPRRRQKAREKGQVARSRDLIAGLATLAAALLVGTQAAAAGGAFHGFLRRMLEAATAGDMPVDHVLMATGLSVIAASGLAVGLAWMTAMVGAVMQGGLIIAPSALAFQISRLSPAQRLRQLWSVAAVSRMLKTLLPVAAIVYLAASVVSRDWTALPHLSRLSASALARFGGADLFEVAWKASLVLLVWSGADYLLERHKLESDLKMSRQELVDEYKETDGNPTVKARIRRLQRQMRRRRMLDDVKRASVVITNPTEFAVALEYGPELAAPRVVAKGRNLVAQQIKQLARWQGIPLVENPPLAHALYRAVEVGQSIPPKLYAVVAEILAAIYRADAQARAVAGAKR